MASWWNLVLVDGILLLVSSQGRAFSTVEDRPMEIPAWDALLKNFSGQRSTITRIFLDEQVLIEDIANSSSSIKGKVFYFLARCHDEYQDKKQTRKWGCDLWPFCSRSRW